LRPSIAALAHHPDQRESERRSRRKGPFGFINSPSVHKHRNLLAHAPERLHEEISADYADMIYAATAEDIEERRQAFLRKWRLRHRAVADCLEEAGDKLFAFTRLPPSQWKSPLDKSFFVAPRSAASAAALRFERAGDHVAKSGRRMRFPPRCLHSRSSFMAPAHPGRFGAVSLWSLAPGADEAAVGRLGLGHEGPFGVAQSLDAVVLGSTRDVAATFGRHAGLIWRSLAWWSAGRPKA
jgi:hypothetical protein